MKSLLTSITLIALCLAAPCYAMGAKVNGAAEISADSMEIEKRGTKRKLDADTQSIDAQDRPFECSKCSKTFPTRNTLNGHMRNHIGNKRFKRAICKKSSTRKQHLKSLKNRTQTKKHMAAVAATLQAAPASLSDPLSSATDTRLMSASSSHNPLSALPPASAVPEVSVPVHSDTSFLNPTPALYQAASSADATLIAMPAAPVLVNPTRKKTVPSKKFHAECAVCNKQFTLRDHFNKHMVSHIKDKRFTCEICKKGFTCELYFKNHIKTLRHARMAALQAASSSHSSSSADPMSLSVPKSGQQAQGIPSTLMPLPSADDIDAFMSPVDDVAVPAEQNPFLDDEESLELPPIPEPEGLPMPEEVESMFESQSAPLAEDVNQPAASIQSSIAQAVSTEKVKIAPELIVITDATGNKLFTCSVCNKYCSHDRVNANKHAKRHSGLAKHLLTRKHASITPLSVCPGLQSSANYATSSLLSSKQSDDSLELRRVSTGLTAASSSSALPAYGAMHELPAPNPIPAQVHSDTSFLNSPAALHQTASHVSYSTMPAVNPMVESSYVYQDASMLPVPAYDYAPQVKIEPSDASMAPVVASDPSSIPIMPSPLFPHADDDDTNGDFQPENPPYFDPYDEGENL